MTNLEAGVFLRSAADALGLDVRIIEYLYKRGYNDLASLKDFLMPKDDFTPASTLKDIDKIVARVSDAIRKDESILIFGDYDCDGICATSVLRLYFNAIGARSTHFIPRRQDGYGLSVATLSRIFEKEKPDLLITVDCGISAVDEVEFCKNNGVDIIVTDHHEPQNVLPDCLILNPKLTVGSPLHDICGCAVAMKLVEALSDKTTADEFLDIVALATVADVVPLVGENRKLVYYGLKKINSFSREGIKQLAIASDLKSITSSDIGYRLAPRINALGRLNDETGVVDLFIENDVFFIKTLVDKIDKANRERQNVTKTMVDQCLEKITPELLMNNKILVLADKNWETGVLGLVAAKLTSTFYRPCILLGNGGNCFKGSARSIPNVNIFKCIEAVSHLTVGFGGHSGAAGMTIEYDKIDEFSRAINMAVESFSVPTDFIPEYSYDIMLSKGGIDKRFCKQLELLAPFGEGNPSPVFALRSKECKMDRIGNSVHIKGRLNSETDVVAFSKDYILSYKKYGFDYNMIVDASIKEFNNREYVQLAVDNVSLDNVDNLTDNSNAFANYSKTCLYRETGAPYPFVKEVDEQFYGTVYLAFSQATAKAFFSARKDRPLKICGVLADADPISCILLYPTDLDNLKYYKNIVLLDTPLSTGYIRVLQNAAPSSNIYCFENYPYKEKFAALDLSAEKIGYTAKKISEHLRSSRKVNGINELFFDLMSFGYDLSNEEFTVHFYVLYEIGWLRVGQEFSLACYGNVPDLSQSRVLKKIESLYE